MSATAKEPIDGQPKRASPLSQLDVPGLPIDVAMRVARVLYDEFAGDPTDPLRVAKAMDLAPSGGRWKLLTGSAIAYGLIEGGAQAGEMRLTPLARRIVAPREEGDDQVAVREAALRPRVINEFLRKYDRKKLPSEAIGRNVLEDEFGVPRERTAAALGMIVSTARAVGVLESMSGGDYVLLAGGASARREEEGPAEESFADNDGSATDDQAEPPVFRSDPPASSMRKPGALFVGHGPNHTPLQQLEKLLSAYSVPYKVAESEPNLARPIPTKVRAVMEECTAAILIFTADAQFFDANGQEIWRPSENVVFELGASSFAYGDRVVIFKETGVQFPTNFASVGYIEFDKDNLAAKGAELLRELIGFGIIQVQVTGA